MPEFPYRFLDTMCILKYLIPQPYLNCTLDPFKVLLGHYAVSMSQRSLKSQGSTGEILSVVEDENENDLIKLKLSRNFNDYSWRTQ